MNRNGALQKLGRKLHKGLLIVLKPLQIVNNTVFLALAYFIGVGISALLYRMGPGKKKPAAGPDSAADTLWRAVPPAPRARGAWLRPF